MTDISVPSRTRRRCRNSPPPVRPDLFSNLFPAAFPGGEKVFRIPADSPVPPPARPGCPYRTSFVIVFRLRFVSFSRRSFCLRSACRFCASVPVIRLPFPVVFPPDFTSYFPVLLPLFGLFFGRLSRHRGFPAGLRCDEIRQDRLFTPKTSRSLRVACSVGVIETVR